MSGEAIHTYAKIARSSSILSVASSIFVICTFAIFPYFRKPINRLIVYASVGNLLCNVATIINISGIPGYGGSLALCRFQGFLIQAFPAADSLWTLSMAINVYLTFFRKYNAKDLQNLEKRYLIINYGLFLVPGLVYLILDISPMRAQIYGGAGFWCWVTERYSWLRFTWCYVPVWFVIILIIAIYITTGKEIFRQRALLRCSHPTDRNSISLLETGNPFEANLRRRIQRTTEIEVICERDGLAIEQSISDQSSQDQPRASYSSTRQLSPPPQPQTHAHQQETPRCPYTGKPGPCNTCCNAVTLPFSDDIRDANTFYTTASVTAGNPPSGEGVPDARFANLHCIESGRSSSVQHEKDAGLADTAAWGYAKVAFLCWVALFIVWIPATINRVWLALHRGKSTPGLIVACAAMMPTQGFWNCVVYIVTSRSECQHAWVDTKNAVSRMVGKISRSPRTREQMGSRLPSPPPILMVALGKTQSEVAVREIKNAQGV